MGEEKGKSKREGNYPLTVGKAFVTMRLPGGMDAVERLNDEILDSVTYLYKTKSAADEGSDKGGTGFFVAIFDHAAQHIHVYAVTAHHVVASGYSVLRTNTISRKPKILEYRPSDWKQHPDGDDLAILPLPSWSPEIYGLNVVPSTLIVSEDSMRKLDIGRGNEVFMSGRFLRYEGPEPDQPNRPFTRFGNIASMPIFLKNDFTKIKQLSFVAEMRSISGYSGSPVFFYMPPLAIKIGLLGVNWGHIRHDEIVVDEEGKEHPDKWRVRSNSSMAGVVPGWKILELLETEELVKRRKEEVEKKNKEPRSEVVPDLEDIPKKPFTKSDFESALKKVSRKLEKK